MTWRATATVAGRLERFATALGPVVDAVATRFFDRLEAALVAEPSAPLEPPGGP